MRKIDLSRPKEWLGQLHPYDWMILLLIVSSLAFYDIKLVFLGMQAIAFAMTGLGLIARPQVKSHVLLFAAWIAGFCLYSLLSCLWASSDNSTAFRTVLSTIQVGLIGFSILQYIKSKKRMRFVINALFVAALILCVRFVIEVPFSEWGKMGRFSKDTIFGGNTPALTLSYIALFALWSALFTKQKNKYMPLLLLVMAALFAFIPILMGTRKGLLILGVGVAVMLLGGCRSVKELLIRIAVLLVLVLVAYVAMMNIPLLYRSIGFRVESLIESLLGFGNEYSSSSVRMDYATDALSVFLNHPVVGVGQDGYRYLNRFTFTYSHCNYTEILANLGIIGFVLYHWFYLWILKQAIQVRKRTLLPLIIIINFIVEDIALVSYSFESRYVFWAVLIGALKYSNQTEVGENAMIKKVIGAVKNPGRIVQYCSRQGWLKWMDDATYLKFVYRMRLGKKLNLDAPRTFNEKLQWLKLYDRKPEYTRLVDKYEVRAYIAKTLGEEYLIPLLGVWDRFEDIDFDSLPDQFVLKCTHDSSSVIICQDKSKLNVSDAGKKLNRCMKNNGYNFGREWPYKNVKPRIIAEKYMVDESGYELKDYKFFCFNGQIRAMFVAKDRTDHTIDTKFDFFDPDFKHLDVRQGHPNSEPPYYKPEKFEEMKEVAKALSQNMPHVRVDLYNINGKIYFGELTFFHYSGFVPFDPPKWDAVFGEWIDLPEIKVEE